MGKCKVKDLPSESKGEQIAHGKAVSVWHVAVITYKFIWWPCIDRFNQFDVDDCSGYPGY